MNEEPLLKRKTGKKVVSGNRDGAQWEDNRANKTQKRREEKKRLNRQKNGSSGKGTVPRQGTGCSKNFLRERAHRKGGGGDTSRGRVWRRLRIQRKAPGDERYGRTKKGGDWA